MPYSDPTVKRARDRERIAAKRAAAAADGGDAGSIDGPSALIALAVVIVAVVVIAAVSLWLRPPSPQPPAHTEPPAPPA